MLESQARTKGRDGTSEGQCRVSLNPEIKILIAGLEVQKGKGDQNGLLNGALSRYIKRKKLEPLDSYLSQILLSDAQLQKLGKLHNVPYSCGQGDNQMDSTDGSYAITYSSLRHNLPVLMSNALNQGTRIR